MENAIRRLFKRKLKEEVYTRESRKIGRLGTLQEFGYYWSIDASNPFRNERLKYAFNSIISRQYGD